ncbi:Phosphatidylinositol/phosphatidylcholine transfer protein SFH2 [Glycine soja]
MILGLPVIAVGVGLSTFDEVFPTTTKNHGRHIDTCVKVLDMTGLKLSALNQLKICHHLQLLTAMSTIDDLNYPEKTEAYCIVNVPCIFSACWKVVKSLLQERTRRKVHVLVAGNTENCFSFDHVFHKQLYNYIKQQAIFIESILPIRQDSFNVDLPEPDPDDVKIAKTIETEFHRIIIID